MTEAYNPSGKKVAVLLLMASVIAVAFQYWKITGHLDWVLYDMQMPLWGSSAPDDVVIIAIDDKSIEKLGRWPWPRNTHARLINQLTEYKTGPIVFNVLFTEPSGQDSTADNKFSQSIANNGQVILSLTGINHSSEGGPFELLPIPELFQAAHSIGHTNLELDPDSKFRRTFLYAGFNEARWPNLAVAALLMKDEIDQLPGQHLAPLPSQSTYSWVRDYYVMIPLIGAPRHFKTLSYSDVLEGTITPEKLLNKYIFIGPTATGLNSGYPTPLRSQKIMSGVEIQANIFEAVRKDQTITELPVSYKLILTLVLTFLGSLLIVLNNWAKSPFYLTVLLLTLFFMSEALLIFGHIYFPVVSIGIALIVTSLSISWLHLLSLQEAVDTDALTGLSNRRFFDKNFSFLWRIGKRYQRPFSLLLIDIDYFKGYNDTYGHDQGDTALQQVAEALKKHKRRAGDEACRIGGEEFAFLISNSDSYATYQYAEQIRKNIQALKIEHKASQTGDFLTVSIGIATVTPTKDMTKKKMFNHADKALYQAKEQGRNQVQSIDLDNSEYILKNSQPL